MNTNTNTNSRRSGRKATTKIPYDLVRGKMSNTIIVRIPKIRIEETDDGSLLIRQKSRSEE